MTMTPRAVAVDLFAGAGGFTEAAEQAGCTVAWAGNHWGAAVEVHAANHPTVQHVCQDLHQADWSMVPKHDLLVASPACQGHAKARGRERSHHDASRSTAWAVVSCAEYHRPPVVVAENVPEFLDWALWPAWRMAMEAMGYRLQPHVLDAADAGVPQHRVRVFVVCTLTRAPLQLQLPRRDHVAIGSVIDWGSTYPWARIDQPGRAAATLARIAAGRAVHGDRFVAPYYGSGSGETGRSVDRPIGTLTTRARWAVVDGDRMRMLQPREACTAQGFPHSYRLPRKADGSVHVTLANHLIGNAVAPPLARDLLQEVLRAA